MSMRRLLFSQNPRCHWCDVVTLLMPEQQATPEELPRVATVDHIKSRCEARTCSEWSASANQVLSCRKCNQKRNSEFFAANPHAKPLFPWKRSLRESGNARKKMAKPAPFSSRDSPPLACCPYYHTHY